MKIREANTADVEALADIASRTFIDAYDDLEPEEAQSYIDQFLSVEAFRVHCDSSSSRVFVADDEKLLGYAHPAKRQIECIRLFVDSGNKGEGIGSRLLAKALEQSAEDGFDCMWLKVWDQNPRAVAFYKRHAFTTLGSVPYTEGGMDDQVFIMVTDLRRS
jgi:ribosomal protein S18 acetylase RimI-like enzyme